MGDVVELKGGKVDAEPMTEFSKGYQKGWQEGVTHGMRFMLERIAEDIQEKVQKLESSSITED